MRLEGLNLMTSVANQPKFVKINGRKLAYDEVSPPNPKGTILLLTGLGSKRLAWYNQLPEFGKYYRTLALDFRDVGDSDPSPAPSYTIADQAGDVAAFLAALGIERVFLVGISMGGFVSLELTLRYPHLVQKLVLVSTSGGGLTHVPASPRIWGIMLRRENIEVGALALKTYSQIMAPGYAAGHPQVMAKIAEIARYRPMSREIYARQFRSCLTHNAANRLDQIRVPALIIHGDKDPLVPIPNGRRLARKITGAKMIEYAGVGHIPIIEQADRFNQDVLKFVNG
jgi:pimeloyl-ACP methyl ester carboxylesterase